MSKNNTDPILSVVVPLFNEQDNIDLLVSRLTDSLSEIGLSYEIVLVDDGSKDDTWDNIQTACVRHPFIRAVRFSRNFGHQHAIFAGLKAAKGQAIVSMDGDLQHPPEVIGSLVREWESGYKIVNTIREDQEVAGPIKRLCSKTFYKIFSILSDVSLQKGSSDFRLIDRQVRDEIISFADMDVFLRGAIQWVGFDVKDVTFTAEARHQGTTKFTFGRMNRLATGAIISYSTVPLKIGVWLGGVTSFLSFCELGYIFYIHTKGVTVPGWASTIGITSLLFGVLFFNIGIIGIYLARIHESLQGRPPYIVSEDCASGVIKPSANQLHHAAVVRKRVARKDYDPSI